MTTNPNDPVALADGLMSLAESMHQVVAATAGYRSVCEEAGFSPTASEVMAIEYHQVLLRAMVK